GESGSRDVLACASFLPGQYQPHQGSRALVQIELSVPYGRQEAYRSSGQPGADAAAAGTVQALSLTMPRGRGLRAAAHQEHSVVGFQQVEIRPRPEYRSGENRCYSRG